MLVCRALAHNVIAFNLVEKEQRFVVAAECLSPGRTNLSVEGGANQAITGPRTPSGGGVAGRSGS